MHEKAAPFAKHAPTCVCFQMRWRQSLPSRGTGPHKSSCAVGTCEQVEQPLCLRSTSPSRPRRQPSCLFTFATVARSVQLQLYRSGGDGPVPRSGLSVPRMRTGAAGGWLSGAGGENRSAKTVYCCPEVLGGTTGRASLLPLCGWRWCCVLC